MSAFATLKIAVASDLHAFTAGTPTDDPSHLSTDLPELPINNHPIASLLDRISTHQLTADYLLCPGDLGDKADPAGIAYAWQQIHRLGSALKVKHTLATTGNHDLDSRYKKNKVDPKGFLQGLSPPYPFPEEDLQNKYWSRNFAILDDKEHPCRILVLNSCAYHGGGLDETAHGRISDATLSALKAELQKREEKPVNICLTHHHPQKQEDIDFDDYEVMDGGQALLTALGSGEYGRWLIVHGHKHFPKIGYAQGCSSAPVVLSAGSLTANLYKELQTRARNQFYLIEIHLTEIDNYGLVGQIYAWDWAVGLGWAPSAGPASGLPKISGFGYREDAKLLARRVSTKLTHDVEDWGKLSDLQKELKYLLWADYKILKQELSKLGYTILEQDGVPVQIGRAT